VDGQGVAKVSPNCAKPRSQGNTMGEAFNGCDMFRIV
jgi:hypothetical protein